MKVGEYLFNEYRELTTKYVAVSQRLRELLPRMADLSREGKLPAQKVTKELLSDFDKTEEEIEATLAKFRKIRHGLLEMLLRSRKD